MITFGQYEQDNKKDNGTEAIEWIVLEKQKDRVLLISKYALIAKPFNDDYKSVDWESCTLRNWLNDSFINLAFQSNERSLILSTPIINSDNQTWGSDGGSSTEDKIFLLSIDEASKYFNTKEERAVKVTEYARMNNAFVNYNNGNGRWWLRSIGRNGHYAAYVRNEGDVNNSGEYVNERTFGIRPALWLSLP